MGDGDAGAVEVEDVGRRVHRSGGRVRFEDAGSAKLAQSPMSAVLGEEPEPLGDPSGAGRSDESPVDELGVNGKHVEDRHRVWSVLAKEGERFGVAVGTSMRLSSSDMATSGRARSIPKGRMGSAAR